MKNYRRKPTVISAVQFDGRNDPPGVHRTTEATDDLPPGMTTVPKGTPYVITIHEQRVSIESGDWIVPERDGEHFYPIRPDVFAATYDEAAPNGGMTFGGALEQLQLGAKVRRAGWNGKGMHLYLVTDMTHRARDGQDSGGMRALQPCIVMFTAQGKYQPGWLASQADILAADWEVAS